jgi:hypothetical protein
MHAVVPAAAAAEVGSELQALAAAEQGMRRAAAAARFDLLQVCRSRCSNAFMLLLIYVPPA